MTTHFIEKSIHIAAPAYKVWELLTNPELIRDWAGAFSECTYVESDFKAESSVVWKTKDGEPGAVGKVTRLHENQLLEIAYYDDVNADPQQQPGVYKETYTLAGTEASVTLLAKAGPLAEEHFKMHEPLWNDALERMKSFAEQRMRLSGMDA